MIEVLSPGFLSTVQDAGRPGFGHLGVPPGGACDPWSLAVANLLVGNAPDVAALEITLVGPDLLVTEPVLIGLAGADLGGIALAGTASAGTASAGTAGAGPSTGRRLTPGGSYRLPAGTVLRFPGPELGEEGARACLAVPGGFDVPVVLGSRSTCLAGAFGGTDGRVLRPGDILRPARSADGEGERRWPGLPSPRRSEAAAPAVRLLPGPGAEGTGRAALDALVDREWRVSALSNRMALRLEGAPPLPPVGTARLLSHGVTFGTVQVPPDGTPIVLLADHQPTGGYPAVAVAIIADRPVLGQLRAGGRLRFRLIEPAEAVVALRRQASPLREGAVAVAEAGRWDEIWHSAGG